MWGFAAHIFVTLILEILLIFNFCKILEFRVNCKVEFGINNSKNFQKFQILVGIYNNSCLKGMKRKRCRNLCILKHFKMSGVFGIFGGFEISSDPRNFSKFLTLFLLCAFNVLHEGEKMIY